MNRKERRKKKMYTTDSFKETEMSRMVKILFGVVLIFLLIYFGFSIYSGELFGPEEVVEEEPVEFQDVNMLAGTTFNMDHDEYYVLYFDYSNKGEASTMQLLYKDVFKPNNGTKMYLSDLSNKFNEPYIAKEGEQINKAPKNINELKVTNPTLIKIKDKKVIEFITGHDKVKEYILKVSNINSYTG